MHRNPKPAATALAVALAAATSVVATPLASATGDVPGSLRPALVDGQSQAVEVVALGDGGLPVDLATTSISDSLVATVFVSSQGPNGFEISITSRNRGRLVRAEGSDRAASDTIRYRLDVESGAGGVLGTDVPPGRERRNLDLAAGTRYLRFDRNPGGDTIDKALDLEIHVDAKPELFSGRFHDVISVGLRDL